MLGGGTRWDRHDGFRLVARCVGILSSLRVAAMSTPAASRRGGDTCRSPGSGAPARPQTPSPNAPASPLSSVGWMPWYWYRPRRWTFQDEYHGEYQKVKSCPQHNRIEVSIQGIQNSKYDHAKSQKVQSCPLLKYTWKVAYSVVSPSRNALLSHQPNSGWNLEDAQVLIRHNSSSLK